MDQNIFTTDQISPVFSPSVGRWFESNRRHQPLQRHTRRGSGSYSLNRVPSDPACSIGPANAHVSDGTKDVNRMSSFPVLR